MYVLGINGGFGGGYQDGCACLYADGKIIAAAEEERLVKIKYATGLFPRFAIGEVLNLAGISMKDVGVVAFHGVTWQSDIENDIGNFLRHHFGYSPPVKRYHHHDAHAASTYYLSGFDEALVITMDNSGDGISSQVMTAKNGMLNLLQRWERPQSFGTFYSCITQLAGFDRDAHEYKLMGLAPYGNPDRFDLSAFLSYAGDGNYKVNPEFLYPIPPQRSFPNKQIPLYSQALLGHLQIKDAFSIPGSSIQQDLAAAAQKQLEEVVCKWVTDWIHTTGMKKLCLAGGVAMNCVLLQRILEVCRPDELYVPPFSGDQGVSIGNAFLAGADNGFFPDTSAFTPYTGRSFSTADIEKILQRDRIPYKIIDDPAMTAAKYIHEGKIIAWFQGGAEIGARALGNRSILADPAIRDIKDKVNGAIKFRDSFRPFCPSVLAADFDEYFESAIREIPYMNITVKCKEQALQEVPGIVHADRTARVQTVSPENNAIFHRLLLNFQKLGGHGVLLNTSLNVRSQPMAYDPADVLAAFYTSGLDAAFLENILIEK